jgi:hypothetical protein
LEQDIMSSEIHPDPRAALERKPPLKDPATQPTQQSGPPMNDGPESPRSNLC